MLAVCSSKATVNIEKNFFSIWKYQRNYILKSHFFFFPRYVFKKNYIGKKKEILFFSVPSQKPENVYDL